MRERFKPIVFASMALAAGMPSYHLEPASSSSHDEYHHGRPRGPETKKKLNKKQRTRKKALAKKSKKRNR